MNTICFLGIDIAKNTFQLHGADHTGKAVMRKRLPRHQLAAYVACTSAKDMAPIGPFSKRDFSASCFSSLAC